MLISKADFDVLKFFKSFVIISGTDGPLPPAWNASVSLNDFSTYTVK